MNDFDAQRSNLSEHLNPSNITISIVPPSVHSEESGIPENPIQTSESSHSGETSTRNEPESTNDSVSLTPCVFEPTIFTYKSDTQWQSTDVFERNGYTTTRTIIRPRSSLPRFLSIFSKSWSPVPGSTSRPKPPFVFNLANLNCMCGTNAFEEELDFTLQQRQDSLAGVTSKVIKVKYTQHRVVFSETKRRDAIQAILLEHTPPVVSCVGHVH